MQLLFCGCRTRTMTITFTDSCSTSWEPKKKCLFFLHKLTSKLLTWGSSSSVMSPKVKEALLLLWLLVGSLSAASATQTRTLFPPRSNCSLRSNRRLYLNCEIWVTSLPKGDNHSLLPSAEGGQIDVTDIPLRTSTYHWSKVDNFVFWNYIFQK